MRAEAPAMLQVVAEIPLDVIRDISIQALKANISLKKGRLHLLALEPVSLGKGIHLL